MSRQFERDTACIRLSLVEQVLTTHRGDQGTDRPGIYSHGASDRRNGAPVIAAQEGDVPPAITAYPSRLIHYNRIVMTNIATIPLRQPLFAEPAGRPGDWWEPVPIRAGVAAGLSAEAARRRLPVDLLATLLVEHARVLHDITDAGIEAGQALAALSVAGEGQATSGPGRLHTSYVRMLRSGEHAYEHESNAQLARRDLVFPLRLHDAALSLELREVCDGDSLNEAVAWEVAAATSGQFMREWALRTLLLQTAAQSARV